MQGRIEDEAFAQQRAVERGDEVIVGVNRYPEGGLATPSCTSSTRRASSARWSGCAAVRAGRDAGRCERALDAVRRGGGDETPQPARADARGARRALHRRRGVRRAQAGVGHATTRRCPTGAERAPASPRGALALRPALGLQLLELGQQLAVGGEALGGDARRALDGAAVLALAVEAALPSQSRPPPRSRGRRSAARRPRRPAMPKLRMPAVSISAPPPGRSM